MDKVINFSKRTTTTCYGCLKYENLLRERCYVLYNALIFSCNCDHKKINRFIKRAEKEFYKLKRNQ